MHHYTHIYMMKGVTKKKIDNLLEELHKPGTFPEDEPAKAMETLMGIGVMFTTVAMLKQ